MVEKIADIMIGILLVVAWMVVIIVAIALVYAIGAEGLHIW